MATIPGQMRITLTVGEGFMKIDGSQATTGLMKINNETGDGLMKLTSPEEEALMKIHPST